jgi:hypothetical protein
MKVYGSKILDEKVEAPIMYGLSTMRRVNGEWVPKLKRREKAALFIKFLFFGIIDSLVVIVVDILGYIDYIVDRD